MATLLREGVFDKALVCTDLTDASFGLVDCASQLKVIGVRSAVLTHVVDVSDIRSEEFAFSKRGTSAFEKQIATLEEHGIDVEVDTPSGYPAFTLSETAERHDVSFIIIGTHGKGIFEGPFSGSTSSDLVNISDKPLLFGVFEGAGEEGLAGAACGRILANVLFATDFSENADRAFGYVRGLVIRGARRITLLHVRDAVAKERPELVGGFTRSDQSRLEKLRRRLLADGAEDVRLALPTGDPEQEILHFLDSSEQSLVVLGARGRGARDEGDFGSVSNTVVRNARTPLLVVPPLRRHRWADSRAS